jgi:hypothetical protein
VYCRTGVKKEAMYTLRSFQSRYDIDLFVSHHDEDLAGGVHYYYYYY